MILKFPYGKSVLELQFPEKNLMFVAESKHIEPLKDEVKEVKKAIAQPIGINGLPDLVKGKEKICIIVSDLTRPTPNHLIVPPILDVLERAGYETGDVEVIIANGLHRPVLDNELEELLGKEVPKRVAIVNHVATDYEQLVKIGKTSYGTEVIVNKKVMEADFVIGTGLIEPHFFAGYSGGRKCILPGVAGRESIFKNHSFEMINHPLARYGVLSGNPIHEDMVEAVKMAKLSFIVNVVIGKYRRILRVFAGDFMKAHESGVIFLENIVKVKVPTKADIVVISNGGYPLDRNLYQAVKGMSTGELVVRKGGVIIMLAECREGVAHHSFYELMAGAKDSNEVFERIKKGEPIEDQWQAQFLARILKTADVIVITKGVKQDTIEDMLMTPASKFEDALELAFRKVGRDAKIIAIPEGPFILPHL